MEMEWHWISQWIDPQFFLVVVVCWVCGAILKQTPIVPDWTIVYIVTVIAVLLTVWLSGWHAEAVIQGILCGAFAVYGNQVVKQSRQRDKDKTS